MSPKPLLTLYFRMSGSYSPHHCGYLGFCTVPLFTCCHFLFLFIVLSHINIHSHGFISIYKWLSATYILSCSLSLKYQHIYLIIYSTSPFEDTNDHSKVACLKTNFWFFISFKLALILPSFSQWQIHLSLFLRTKTLALSWVQVILTSQNW